MRRRVASINDLPILEKDRLFRWTTPVRPTITRPNGIGIMTPQARVLHLFYFRSSTSKKR